ncbi:MAG: glycosyltransferase [Candidatus Limivicinus sp.]
MEQKTIKYIREINTKKNSAGTKAPGDIYVLCEKRGYEPYMVQYDYMSQTKREKLNWLLFSALKEYRRMCKSLHSEDIVFHQHRDFRNVFLGKLLILAKKKKNFKLILLIHDLEFLRYAAENKKWTYRIKSSLEKQILRSSDVVICHNEHMKDYLVKFGIPEEKLICLGLFDYLTNEKITEKPRPEETTFVFAGSLSPRKSGFIYELPSSGILKHAKIDVYGPAYDERLGSKKISYKGVLSPEKLPNVLTGTFGLSWDGSSCETLQGTMGHYLPYINPHKVSLYLVSQLPVVISRNVGCADFIQKNGLGIAIDSLNDLPGIVDKLGTDMYEQIQKNVIECSNKLNSGYFFYRALDKALEAISKMHI